MSNDTAKFVFFDNTLEHRVLAEDIQRNAKGKVEIIFVVSQSPFGDEEWCDFKKRVPLREITYKGDVCKFEDADFRKLFGGGRSNFFFITKNADRNVSMSFMVMAAAKKLSISYDDFSMFIAPNWEDVEAFLVRRQREMAMNFDIKLINPARLAAYILSKKVRPVDCLEFDAQTLKAKRDFSVAVVGLGLNSREAMFKTYQQGRFEGSNFVVDIFDISAGLKLKSFIQKFPGFPKDAKISAIDLESFDRLGDFDFTKYDIVIVDFGTDADRIDFAKALQRRLLDDMNISVTIAPFIENPAAANFEDCPNIQFFGDARSIFSIEAIIADSFTKGGRFVNDYYNSTKLDSMKIHNWIGLSDFEKGSNVSVADFNYSFIKLIGRETFKKFGSAEEFKNWLRANPEKYDTLARTEHLRWCAYLYSNGWNTMPLEGEIMVENKDMQKKLHTCLVPFDELKRVSEMFNEDYEKYDRDNVDIIFDIYKKLNG